VRRPAQQRFTRSPAPDRAAYRNRTDDLRITRATAARGTRLEMLCDKGGNSLINTLDFIVHAVIVRTSCGPLKHMTSGKPRRSMPRCEDSAHAPCASQASP
jgi:hypothetical protein